jgi:hypothetical protein
MRSIRYLAIEIRAVVAIPIPTMPTTPAVARSAEPASSSLGPVAGRWNGSEALMVSILPVVAFTQTMAGLWRADIIRAG